MAVTEQDITLALQTVADPLTGQDFVAAKAIKHLNIQDGAVSFDLVLGYPAKSLWDSYRQQLEHVVSQVPGVSSVKVTVSSQVVAHTAQPGVALLPQVKNIIAVASGKGGVGKSTVAVNIAVALAKMGKRVGIMDADIYGPNLPLMLGVDAAPSMVDEKIIPLEA